MVSSTGILPQRRQALWLVLLASVLAVNVWCAGRIHQLTRQRASIKADYSDANSIQYGLLSVQVWMGHLRTLVARKIDAFTLSRKQEAALRAQIARELDALITQADRVVEADPGTLKGKIRRAAAKVLVDKEALRRKIPELTQTLLDEASRPGSRRRLKALAQEELSRYSAETYDRGTDISHIDRYLARYHVKSLGELNRVTVYQMAVLQHQTYHYVFAMLVSMLLLLLSWWTVRHERTLHGLQKPLFVLSVLLALVVLLVGLTSPMIEIDARIRQVDFVLMGEHLQFNDQVLFFQSKSILQVVEILLRTHKADSLIVGVLILLFSIVFPISKLVSTEVFLLAGRRNRLIRFLAFKTGKWSMADVMVVAIFMAYVGFKGILDSQLEGLNVSSASLSSIATNETSLQPGFILFTAFVLYGLVLSEILKWMARPQHRAARKTRRRPRRARRQRAARALSTPRAVDAAVEPVAQRPRNERR